MCGIIGFIFKNSLDEEFLDNQIIAIYNSVEKIKNRGVSGYGLTVNELCHYFKNFNEFEVFVKNSLKESIRKIQDSHIRVYVHMLHAIHTKTLQPIYDYQTNSVLLFNGEIYNFELLNQYKCKKDQNSDTLALNEYLNTFSNDKLRTNFKTIIDKIDGDFAFVYQREHELYLCRDFLGVKPLWYEFLEKEEIFIFSSEKKTLSKKANELNPKNYIHFDIINQKLSIHSIKEKYCLSSNKNSKKEFLSYDNSREETFSKLQKAIEKRISFTSNKRIGLLFSGGVDSTVIALLLQKNGVDFTCYNAELISKTLSRAEDSLYSEKIAEKFEFDLIIESISQEELEKLLIETISIIESCDYIKVSVALPFLAACKRAKQDGVEIMFSGLGSEELFAGYRRHRQVSDINKECLNGLNVLHERDLYRDDVITMSQTQELRVPFLDQDLIKYSLNLPPSFKIDVEKIEEIKDDSYKKPFLNKEIRSKIILRDIAIKYLGLDEEYANRQKKAAQYGSKFDKGLQRLAKNRGLAKQEYLKYLVKKNNLLVFD